MHIGTWVSVVAAAISLAALYFTWQQTRIQRQVRIDAAQPYVWADVRPDDKVGTIMNLLVGNTGPTVARNVRVTVDPPLPSIEQLRERAETATGMLGSGLRSIPPGRQLSWPLGQGFSIIGKSGPQAHTITVTADGPFGPVPPLIYVVDLADWRGSVHRPAGSLHELTKAVTDIGKRIDG